MSKKNKLDKKIISISLMVIGVGLAYWGYQMSGSVGSQINQAFTGSSSDGVVIRYIGGAVSFVIGLYLFKNK